MNVASSESLRKPKTALRKDGQKICQPRQQLRQQGQGAISGTAGGWQHVEKWKNGEIFDYIIRQSGGGANGRRPEH